MFSGGLVSCDIRFIQIFGGGREGGRFSQKEASDESWIVLHIGVTYLHSLSHCNKSAGRFIGHVLNVTDIGFSSYSERK